ncbi:MAG: glycosyltransferase family 2 protein [Chlorobia bacterium]|nr:glycosyltransferase family 2 protein [Fimbriimonadaceae bacterium]
MLNLTAVVLTFNSASSLAGVIRSCRSLANRIIVVDSNSGDDTVRIAKELGCVVVSHPFEDYSSQRNWAQEYAALSEGEWVLHLDSDEELSDELRRSIETALSNPTADGYLMRRITHFWGKPIRFGHMNPSWHLRLFRAGAGRCEDRLYDQHFLCSGKTEKLKGVLLDMQSVDLERWTATHNRWSTMEAQEMIAVRQTKNGKLRESLFGDRRERKRWIKNRLWYRSPLFIRTYVFFFYSYVLKLGFLDGGVGLVYHTLQAFWFRFLVDAKIKEAQTLNKKS